MAVCKFYLMIVFRGGLAVRKQSKMRPGHHQLQLLTHFVEYEDEVVLLILKNKRYEIEIRDLLGKYEN